MLVATASLEDVNVCACDRPYHMFCVFLGSTHVFTGGSNVVLFSLFVLLSIGARCARFSFSPVQLARMSSICVV